jgi:hypothetical protein
MNRLSTSLRVITVLLGLTLLVACAPGEELPSPEEIEAAINTAVAQTMEAEGKIATSVAMTVTAREAEAARALPTDTPTPIPPLPTLTPVLPTATPFTVAPSSGGGGGGGGGTTSYEYSCDIIRQRPRDNTEYKRKHTFDVSFVILNNGTATWPAGKDVTLTQDLGNALGIPIGTVVLQLGEMKPGDTSAVIGPFDAAAPDEAGFYVINFKVEGGFCWPYVAFKVVR